MDQYNIEIFSCFLRLLPVCSSTFHQTNVGFCHGGSEDNLSISRIQSLHHLLKVDDQVSGSIPVQDLSPIRTVLVDEQAEVRLRGFALAFDRLAKANTSVFNAKSSDCISEVSCSMSSWSLLLKSVTNLFKS